MKKTLILSLCLLSLNSAFSQWTTRQLPTPRTRMAGVYADGKAIFAGGLSQLSPQYTASAVVDIYDLATANWTSAALSVPRFAVSAVVSGDKILFAGGITLTGSGNSVNSDVVDIYDIPTASWSQTTLPVSASDLSAAAIGDKVYFAKGSSFGYDDIWVYEVPTGLWSILEIPGGHRQRMSVAAIGSKILFAGGLNDNNQSSDILNIYDTETNTWSVKTLSEPRSGISAVTLGTSCYFTGGLYGTYTSDNMDIYDDATGEISSKTMPVPRFNHAAGTHNGEIMIGSQGELSSSGGPLISITRRVTPGHHHLPIFFLILPNTLSKLRYRRLQVYFLLVESAGSLAHWKMMFLSCPTPLRQKPQPRRHYKSAQPLPTTWSISACRIIFPVSWM